MWVPKLEKGLPKPEALVRALRQAIQSGTLKANDRLPAQRDLAYALGVNLSTVSRAMEEATRQGLVGGEVGRGTFVLPRSDAALLFARMAQAQDAIDLGTIVPPHLDAIALKFAFAKVLDIGLDLYGYPTQTHIYQAEEAVRSWIAWRGMPHTKGSVALTTGAHSALSAVIAAILKPGQTILTEAFTFPGMKAIAQRFGLKLFGVACDAEGLLPDALELACKQTEATVLVAMPNLHNPTGSIMSPRRRAEIVDVIHRTQLTLIEDDVYGSYARQPPLMAQLDGAHVLISSLSKSVAPALRFGFAFGNHSSVARIKEETVTGSWFVSPLPLMTATQMIEDGTAMRFAQAQVQEISARWTIVRRFFPEIATQPAGHFWLGVENAIKFEATALQLGVRIVSGDVFATSRHVAEHVRIAICAEPIARLTQGLAMIAALKGEQDRAKS